MWVKGAASNPSGNCVEQWVKGAVSTNNGSCVEVMREDVTGNVRVRDSKETSKRELRIAAEDCDSGVALVFEPVATGAVPMYLRAMAVMREHAEGQWYVLHGTDPETGQPGTLYFDQGEKDAWEASVAADGYIVVL